MPTRQKQFVHRTKKPSKIAPEPETEHDFFAAAEEHEQSGGKWRRGDPERASRFFRRALEVYDAGLKRHPKSFDLAYNNAHLQLEIAEQPQIGTHFGPVVILLEEALRSHRYALSLESDVKADVLFNTAQVMISLAEELERNETRDSSSRVQRMKLAQEALGLLTECLRTQEQELAKLAAQTGTTPGDDQEDGLKSAPSSLSASAEIGEWAAVVQTVSPRDIIDTAVLIFTVLEHIVGALEATDRVVGPTLNAMAETLLKEKLPPYIAMLSSTVEEQRESSPPPSNPTISISARTAPPCPLRDALRSTPQISTQEAAKLETNLAHASFMAAQFDKILRSHTPHLTPTMILNLVGLAFRAVHSHKAGRLAEADAHLDLVATLSTDFPTPDHAGETHPEFDNSTSPIRQEALTHAQSLLESSATSPRTPGIALSLADIHLSHVRYTRTDLQLTAASNAAALQAQTAHLRAVQGLCHEAEAVTLDSVPPSALLAPSPVSNSNGDNRRPPRWFFSTPEGRLWAEARVKAAVAVFKLHRLPLASDAPFEDDKQGQEHQDNSQGGEGLQQEDDANADANANANSHAVRTVTISMTPAEKAAAELEEYRKARMTLSEDCGGLPREMGERILMAMVEDEGLLGREEAEMVSTWAWKADWDMDRA